MEWWKHASVYQIYPRSFCDSNGDGIGDIPGIISKLDYLKDLGVDVLWLSPVYPSPNEDNGYDISDYCDIHPDFGTLSDFDRLVSEARRRDISIIMDLVINHTSTEHPWFQASRDPDSPYRDYYYWRPGKGKKLPNNWTGFFGGDVWQYDRKSHEYYLHLFAPHQADLNYHNPAVLEEVKKILRFWLDRGVRGFRCDVINILFKDSLKSSLKKPALTGSEHYLSLPGTHEILKELGSIIREYDAFTVGETVFVNTEQANELCAPERGELNMVFGFEHMECDQHLLKWFKKDFHWKQFMKVLEKWQMEVPWNTIYLENHDQPRSVSRFGSNRYPEASAKLLATLLCTLKGTPFIYEGQEIGMTNFDFSSMKQIQDVESHNVYKILTSMHIPEGKRWEMIKKTSRDNARTPMQWTAEDGAGFTDGTPWLGINHNYTEINVFSQIRDPKSVYTAYKELLALRKRTPDLLQGEFQLLETSDTLSVYRRGGIMVILNHSDKTAQVDYNGTLLYDSYGYQIFDGALQPWEALILG